MIKHLLYQTRKLVYQVHGSGKPVIFIHGFGEDSRVWNQQVEYLRKDFQLIIPDLPGSGRSEMIDDMSIEGMAEVIHSIIHEENIDQCIVIGHSMGGYITLALAEKYWNHLLGFGLFHSTAFADTEEKKVARRKGIEFIQQHGAFQFLKTTSPNLFSPGTKEKRPGIVTEFINGLSGFTAPALIHYYEAMIARPDRTHVLIDSTVPVLFVTGEYDNAVPMADILKQCHLPDRSYIHILQGSGHMGMMEETEASNKLLNHFLFSV